MLRQVKKTSPEKFRTVELKELAPAARESWIKTEHLDHGGPEICRSCDLPKKDSPLWIKRLM